MRHYNWLWLCVVVFVGCRTEAPRDPSPKVERSTAALMANEETVFRPASPAGNDAVGASVAISGDGTLVALGAPNDTALQAVNEGSVRLFAKLAGAWSEQPLLRAVSPGTNDRFGASVSMSEDGTRILVGVPFDDTARGVDSGNAIVFVRSGTGWVFEAELLPLDAAQGDLLGASVALTPDGRRAFVGAPGDDVKSTANTGSIRAFVRTAAGWTEDATLAPPMTVGSEAIGFAVATDPTGSVVFAGARFEATTAGMNAGTVHVYERNGASWAELQRLEALSPAAGDGFGASVAISGDGRSAMIGVPLDDTTIAVDSGSVRWFTRSGPGAPWSEQTTLLPASAAEGPSYGLAVSLRPDGLRAVVASPNASGGVGVARVWSSSGTAWAVDVPLTFSLSAASQQYGNAVALASNGASIVVGIPGFDFMSLTDPGGGALFTLDALATGGTCTSNAQCTSGSCVDGVCCDTACGAGTDSCLGCAAARTGLPNGTCGPLRSGTTCRASRGECDRAEVCNGTSAVCPGDELFPVNTLCRSRADVCDAEERCTGVSPSCPPDGFSPSTQRCREAAGPCDEVDFCTGASVACPQNFKPANTECAPSGGGICDAPDVCDGMSVGCRQVYLTNVVCRPSQGACDLQEVCVWGPECPPDNVIPAGISCRGSTQYLCDPAEACDGIAPTCPSDVNTCVGETPMCPAPTCPTCPTCPMCPAPQPQPATGCSMVGDPAAWSVAVLVLAMRVRRRRTLG